MLLVRHLVTTLALANNDHTLASVHIATFMLTTVKSKRARICGVGRGGNT